MAFSGITKLIQNLTAKSTVADTDNFIFGASDIFRITFANLRKALGIDELNANTIIPVIYETGFSDSRNDLTSYVIKKGNSFHLTINAASSADFTYGFTDVCTLPEGYRPQRKIMGICSLGTNMWNQTGFGTFIVDPNGAVSIATSNTGMKNARFNCSF